jgi:hypothetical protein
MALPHSTLEGATIEPRASRVTRALKTCNLATQRFAVLLQRSQSKVSPVLYRLVQVRIITPFSSLILQLTTTTMQSYRTATFISQQRQPQVGAAAVVVPERCLAALVPEPVV